MVRVPVDDPTTMHMGCINWTQYVSPQKEGISLGRRCVGKKTRVDGWRNPTYIGYIYETFKEQIFKDSDFSQIDI